MTNINPKTGIRYGVISQHAVSQAWAESAVADYGDPTCPRCGNEVKAYELDPGDMVDAFPRYDAGGSDDFYCLNCEHLLDASDCSGDEPVGFQYVEEGYELVDCLDSDIMVIDSPFYTFAPLCSPCVPNAGNLDDAADFHETEALTDWQDVLPRAYCLGHDWFDSGRAPYPVYGAVSKRPCFPDNWYGHSISIADAARYPHWYGWDLLTMPAGADKTDYCA